MNNTLGTIIVFTFMLGYAGNALAGESMKLSENDSGKTVEICVGDELEVRLPGNPTTGYIWAVNSLASNVLGLGNTHFIANDNAVGAGGTEVIKFHAIALGTVVVKLIFHRPFEPNIPPLKTFNVTVIIKKQPFD
jgi:predicted secreted protein